MSNREISIARLNAKIYTQRTALINYQDLLQEKKAELAKLKQQLAIAVDYISELNKKFEIFLVSDKKRTMKEVEDALFDYEMLLLKAYGFACNTKINEELNK